MCLQSQPSAQSCSSRFVNLQSKWSEQQGNWHRFVYPFQVRYADGEKICQVLLGGAADKAIQAAGAERFVRRVDPVCPQFMVLQTHLESLWHEVVDDEYFDEILDQELDDTQFEMGVCAMIIMGVDARQGVVEFRVLLSLHLSQSWYGIIDSTIYSNFYI